MKITYDPTADAAYLYFKEGVAEVTTIRVTEDLAVDLGPNEELVGLEILSASRYLGFARDGKPVTVEVPTS